MTYKQLGLASQIGTSLRVLVPLLAATLAGACGSPEGDFEGAVVPSNLATGSGEVRTGLAAAIDTRTPRRIYATTETTKIFLWYADGGPAPLEGPPCAGKRPPAYTCSFGKDEDDCKRQVQDYLNRWYADFNVTFTLTRPTSGPYYTVVITSSGGWCDQPSTVGGVAPINCRDLEGGTSYAFLCGRHAKTCASIIAQEHAHTVGLAHTSSRVDVMFPTVQSTNEGFENTLNTVSGDLCRPTQNSYTMMLERLGRWTGGPKPSPFGGMVVLDDVPPEADGGLPPVSSPTGDGGTSPTEPIRALPGGDGGTGPAIIFAPGDRIADAAGCSVGPTGTRARSGSWLPALALAALAFRRRR